MKKLLWPVFALLAACSPPQPARQPTDYFALKPFLDSQIAVLTAQKPRVSKTILTDGQPETRQTNAVNWAEELDLFAQADLSKPAYRGSYVVEEISKTTTTYRLKTGQALPVQFLEVIRDEKTGQPAKLKASLRTQNYLYQSERTLSLTCPNGRLSRYEIAGFQQLFYGDPEPFRVEGRIL